MRTILFIGVVVLFLSSCTEKAPLETDTTSKAQLDTVSTEVFAYDTITLTCSQTLIVKANYYWGAYGQADTSAIEYLWTTGDTTPTTTISNVPDRSLTIVGVTMSTWVTSRIWVNDTTYRDSTYLLTVYGDIPVRGRYLPLCVIPGRFTPNSDGMNDIFNVTAICFSGTYLKVYDSFSRTLIFESTDINQGWDGTYKGKNVPVGEYIYHFEMTSVDNQTTELEGYFQLVR